MSERNEPDTPTVHSRRSLYLVAAARYAIEKRLGVKTIEPVPPDDPFFAEKRPLFVTLHKDGALRGCIGSLTASGTVAQEVQRLAVAAAFHDSRFSPVSVDELPALTISISVLTPSVPLTFSGPSDLLAKIRPGIDGVTISLKGRSATFLPQVWEQLPDSKAFLSQLCVKAGLPRDAWQDTALVVSTYQSESYGEKG